MSAKIQSDSRAALVTLLQAALVGIGKPTQAVFDSPPGDFGGKAPVVIVADGGAVRKPRELSGTKYRSRFREFVEIWAADADASAGWTDKNAADQLAAIEAAIADVLSANRKTVDWNWIGHEDEAQLDWVPDFGGKPYVVLGIPIILEVFDA